MILREPFLITSRLLPGLRCGGAWIALEMIGCVENRCVYRWYIDLPGGEEYSEADLKSGCGGEPPLQQMFGTLLAFLGAAAESRWYRDWKGLKEIDEDSNEGLFPPAVVEWATENSDELAALQCEIEDSGAILIREDDDV